jgi:hypothetical protein
MGSSPPPVSSNTHKQTMSDETPKAKRQKTEQRLAFEEDMARIRASQAAAGPAAIPAEEENAIAPEDGDAPMEQEPHHQVPEDDGEQQPWPQATSNGTSGAAHHDSDDEEGGNWLQNYTAHHTRVGEDYQVVDLPSPLSGGEGGQQQPQQQQHRVEAAD